MPIDALLLQPHLLAVAVDHRLDEILGREDLLGRAAVHAPNKPVAAGISARP